MYKSSIEKIAPTKRSKKFLRFYIVRKEGEGANNELNENEIESMIG